jgi:hypothetical protein
MYGHEQQMTVLVEKQKVLETLIKNLTKHKLEVAEALEGFAAKAEAALAEELERVRKGKVDGVQVILPAPKSFVRAFESAIAMLEAHQGATISLTQKQFETYMMNRWDWLRAYQMSNSAYSGTVASMPGDEDEN